MKWIKASEQLPPTHETVIIKDTDGIAYTDSASKWDERINDYEWLDESPTGKGYNEQLLRLAISVGLQVGCSPNYKIDNREIEIENILNSKWFKSSLPPQPVKDDCLKIFHNKVSSVKTKKPSY